MAVVHCTDLRLCNMRSQRQRRLSVVLGVHHLGRYTCNEVDGEALVNSKQFSLFTPKDSVLYNFEHAHAQTDLASNSQVSS